MKVESCHGKENRRGLRKKAEDRKGYVLTGKKKGVRKILRIGWPYTV